MTYFYGLKCEARNRNKSKGMTGIIKLNILVIAAFIVLSAAYLVATDDIVGKSYRLREAQRQIKEQKDFAKKFENKQAELSALYNLERAAKELNLVAVDKVKYLDAIDSSVALVNRR